MNTFVSRSFGQGMVITAEIKNTSKYFRWRLIGPSAKTEWDGDYEGILILKEGTRTFAYATDYWRGILPTEEPFEITTGIPSITPDSHKM
jgi:hypothetical protein